MAFAINYPAAGGKGASSNDQLVTACGTFDEFPEGGPYHIEGMLFPASSPPTATVPPAGASKGTVLGASSTWHFNGCFPPLEPCIVGSSYILRVWLTSNEVTFYLHRDAEFTACDASDANCSVNCPDGGGLALMGARAAEPVIADCASRYFDVVPAADVATLLQFFGAQASELSKLKVRLSYDEARSNFDRAVWSAASAPGEQLRLEVTTGSCCARAILARVRIGVNTIETLERWTSDYFDMIDGGTLEGGGAVGVLPAGRVRVVRATKTEPRGSAVVAKKAAKRGRAATRRKGR
jgi:hypothetical protein